MTGNINLSILFYGQFTAEQNNVIQSFLRSLENTENDHVAAVHRWWDVIESYQLFTGLTPTTRTPPMLTLTYFKSLVKKADLGKPNTLFVFFIGSQVTVHQLCRGKCYDHDLIDNKPYLVVENPKILCHGACGWPFQRLDYGTPNQVMVKPLNGNMGIDAMIIHFASGLAADESILYYIFYHIFNIIW
ncbi:hypothetical protein DVH24_038732 [Malus domestica]|uniref:Uncharacterized protein n=1 Tax=Malus domestica TaxID=3750 RepID=A0A498KAF1_MALDO|nr:hypothetical protein DVH24_038732 [Malus domestica]